MNDLTFEDIERVMAVTFWGVVKVCNAFLPVLLERPGVEEARRAASRLMSQRATAMIANEMKAALD